MDENDLELNNFFTKDGKDIWKLESCYKTPSCTLRNLETNTTVNFGIGDLMAKDFHRIEMPKPENLEHQSPDSRTSLRAQQTLKDLPRTEKRDV